MRTRDSALRLVLGAAAALAAMLLPSAVYGQISFDHRWYVDAGAPGDPCAIGGIGECWENAFTDLQAALSEAADSLGPDEIWVAAGTYYADGGTGLPTSTLQLQNDVSIFGGFPQGGGDFDERDPALYETILSGDFQAGAPEQTHPACSDPDPMAGDCINDATPGIPGCMNADCCEAVCLDLAFCCELPLGWTEDCADHAVMIGCGQPGPTAVYHVVTANGVGTSARLDGFTITGGIAAGTGSFEDLGGGMLIRNASPVIARCTFLRNSAANGGGLAAMVDQSGPVPALVNCAFLGNTATGTGGGGMYNVGSDPRLINCMFVGNEAPLGFGAAIYNDEDSDLGVSTEAVIVNCTMTANTALAGGGAYDEAFSTSTITNCVLWQNGGGQIDSPNAVVTFSCIEGGFAGVGNVADDPLFEVLPDPGAGGWGTADDDYGDLRLMLGSPCNDAGLSEAVPSDIADVDGDGDTFEQTPRDAGLLPRFAVDLTLQAPHFCAAVPVDMGAFESADCDGNGTRDELDGQAAAVIARASRDTPRDALSLLHSARDEAQLRGLDSIDAGTARSVLDSLGIDPSGLKPIERQCLRVLEEARVPVGLRTLADRLGKSMRAIQTVHEPFLVRRGLVRRTRAGRVLVHPSPEATGSSSPAA